jgi:hypothetical protein
MKVVLTSQELLIAINSHLACAGFRGWYEPTEPLPTVELRQGGKPVREPLSVLSGPLPFPEG